jgi:VWFA-related protein
MRLGKIEAITGALAVALTATGIACAQQQTTGTAQQSTLPSAPAAPVPNAPRPQTLPTLNTITPPGPAIPQADTPAAATPVDNAGAAAPGTSLPATPTPQTPVDNTPAPELPAPGDATAAMQPLRIQVNFVEVPFTVKDAHGNLVPGLTWRDVRVYENGVRQMPRIFTTDPFPLAVALVIDQSVTQDTMTKINDSLAALQGAFTPYDEVAVFTYNNGVRQQTTFTAAQSPRLGVILDRSKGTGREALMPLGGPIAQTTYKNNMPVDVNTQPVGRGNSQFEQAPREYHTLNDAILAAAQETATAPRGRRRIVYVISDGKEYGSVAKEKDVIKYLQTNQVAVYATLVGDSAVPGMGFLDRIHLPLTMRDDVLPRYASATGGQIDPEFRPRGIEASFAKITETVRNQYTVGYYSHEPVIDGKFRHIEVRVMRPGLTVIAKDGYYPNPHDSAPPPRSVPVATP